MLNEFTAFMADLPFGLIEQAIFNHMLHTGVFRIKLETAPNITSAVATPAREAGHGSVKIVDSVTCRASDSGIIPIAHMYDGWPDTDALCMDKFRKARDTNNLNSSGISTAVNGTLNEVPPNTATSLFVLD